jgi:hypothetical protein
MRDRRCRMFHPEASPGTRRSWFATLVPTSLRASVREMRWSFSPQNRGNSHVVPRLPDWLVNNGGALPARPGTPPVHECTFRRPETHNLTRGVPRPTFGARRSHAIHPPPPRTAHDGLAGRARLLCDRRTGRRAGRGSPCSAPTSLRGDLGLPGTGRGIAARGNGAHHRHLLRRRVPVVEREDHRQHPEAIGDDAGRREAPRTWR